MMNRRTFTASAFGSLVVAGAAQADEPLSAHDFAFDGIAGGEIALADYAGRPVLVVNTASLCGFTPQYEGLQALWERYRDAGLVVVGVPSDNFGGQEYSSAAEVKEFCEVNFSVDFPLAAITDVTGPARHPFYDWAVEMLGARAAPRWNFHKYLVAPDGSLAAWFPTNVSPQDARVIGAIEDALAGS